MIGTTQQIQLQKLQKIIFNHVINDADCLGEILLKYCFIGEGRGCYSNFNLRPEFRLYTAGKDQFSRHLLGDCISWMTESDYEQEINSINSYIDAELDLVIVWLYEHDGHLVFKFGDIMLENTDIKKSYGWRFI
jgi:hypothetical protein